MVMVVPSSWSRGFVLFVIGWLGVTWMKGLAG